MTARFHFFENCHCVGYWSASFFTLNSHHRDASPEARALCHQRAQAPREARAGTHSRDTPTSPAMKAGTAEPASQHVAQVRVLLHSFHDIPWLFPTTYIQTFCPLPRLARLFVFVFFLRGSNRCRVKEGLVNVHADRCAFSLAHCLWGSVWAETMCLLPFRFLICQRCEFMYWIWFMIVSFLE